MRRPITKCTAILAMLLALILPAGLAAADKYELTMDRYRPVGSKFNVQLEGEQTSRMSQVVDGKRAGSQFSKVTGKLSGVVEVLEKHENKDTKSIAVKIDQYEGQRNSVDVKLDTSKRIVATAEEGELALAYEDGSELSEAAVEYLDMLITFMVEETPSDVEDDQMFRLQQPRAVGSSWQCDRKLLAEDIAAGGKMAIDPEKIDAQFTFKDIVKLNEERAADFEVNIKLESVSIPALVEQGFKITKSSGGVTMAGKLPLDPKSNNGDTGMAMNFDFTAELNANGSNIKIMTSVKATAHAKYTEIKE